MTTMHGSSGPLVSVLIPAFNSGRWIGETLAAVLAQTYTRVEPIVVDDGSTDGTPNLVQSFAAAGVRLVTQQNAGAAAARNHAFSQSQGDFVLYLDADDLIDPEHISSLINAMQGQGDDVIAFGQWDRFYRDRAEAVFPQRPTNADMPGVDWLLTDWERVNMQQCGMFLLPRRHVERWGGWTPHLSRGPIDDFEFFARMISAARLMRFAPGAKLFYRSGLGGSLSRRNSREAVQAKLESLQLGTSHLLAKTDCARARLACANKLQQFIYETYPSHPDLQARAARRVADLAKPTIAPDGPPGFHRLRRLLGWRLARRVQLWATAAGLNGAGRREARAALHTK